MVSIRKACLRFWSLNLFAFSGHPLITVKQILSSSKMASLVYERRKLHCRHLHFTEIDYMGDDVILVPRDLLKKCVVSFDHVVCDNIRAKPVIEGKRTVFICYLENDVHSNTYPSTVQK